MNRWNTPAVNKDTFMGDLLNTLLLRPVYRKPRPAPGPEPIPELPDPGPEAGVFYAAERRINDDETVVVGVANGIQRALQGYGLLIDDAVGSTTYMVRLFRIPSPPGVDTGNPEEAVRVAFEYAKSDYAGAEQIGAFARLENKVLIDINQIAGPHLT